MQPDEKTVFTEHQTISMERRRRILTWGPENGSWRPESGSWGPETSSCRSYSCTFQQAKEQTDCGINVWPGFCVCLCKCVDGLVSEPCSSSDHRYNGYTLARLLLFQPTNERKAGSPSTLCLCVFVYELLCQSFTIIVALIAISLCWCFENYANTVGAHLLQK